MIGDCFINGKDAYSEWKLVMGVDSVSALMTPPPLKPFTTNKSRTVDGEEVLVKNPRYESRDLQFEISICANSKSEFISNYNKFMLELKTGILNIKTKYQQDVLYRLMYVSCSQFTQFNGKLGKFMLKLHEPNPANRSI